MDSNFLKKLLFWKESDDQVLDTIEINLGIDFGTSFTKVCFFDVGTEEARLVTFNYKITQPEQIERAFLPSSIAIEPSGNLKIAFESHSEEDLIIHYLKMRLAERYSGQKLPKFKGIDLNSIDTISALCSWYLTGVIRHSQTWIENTEGDRLKNREPVWSANLGVPVDYFDSEVISRFENVLKVAWQWVKSDEVPNTLESVTSSYSKVQKQLDEFTSDFHAIPEIQAAVQSFVSSREATPGLYVYFDIGGGTLDGAVFRFHRDGRESPISFYSGKVEQLGVSMLYETVTGESVNSVSASMLEDRLENCESSNLLAFKNNIRLLVGNVIMNAKSKQPSNWIESVRPVLSLARKIHMPVESKDEIALPIFIGGGGANSDWYTKSIESTYWSFDHKSAGIPHYELHRVPRAHDLDMHGIVDQYFSRFAVSYGLSFPYEGDSSFRLPSQVPDFTIPESKISSGVVSYEDTKDVFD